MRLYDNDEYREEFMALVYRLLVSDGTNDRANQIIDAFDCAPEVEAEPIPLNDPLAMEELREKGFEPVKHGFWNIEQPINYLVKPWSVSCSVCGWSTTRETNYCPNCGARMDADTKRKKTE